MWGKLLTLIACILLLIPVTSVANDELAASFSPDYYLDTRTLPDGMTISISHTNEHPFLRPSNKRKKRKETVNYLTYTFSFTNGRKVYAGVDFEDLETANFARCLDTNTDSGSVASQCANWPELKKSIMTMQAFDFTKFRWVVLNDTPTITTSNYEKIDFQLLNITETKSLIWKQSLNINSQEAE